MPEKVWYAAIMTFPQFGTPPPSTEDRGSPRPNQRGSLVNERNERHVLPRRSRRVLAGVSSLVLTAALALAAAVPLEASARGKQVGTASWYGPGFTARRPRAANASTRTPSPPPIGVGRSGPGPG